jgi:hypothetical protein
MDTGRAETQAQIAARLGAVRARIALAARRCNRLADGVTLVAVSKTQPAETVAAGAAAGLKHFGENRAEEAAPKAAEVARLLPDAAVTWHMVGHVQGRKASAVLPWAALVHSVDSLKLAEKFDRLCEAGGQRLALLLEVNVSGEAAKYGIAPSDLPAAVDAVAALPNLDLRGLMTVAPLSGDPERARPIFAGLRELLLAQARRRPDLTLDQLSMGMTDDFEVAIEEGATIVRIGRAIFGDRG